MRQRARANGVPHGSGAPRCFASAQTGRRCVREDRNARRTRVILDCGGLQRTATICSSSGSRAVTEAKEGECRFSGVRAGRQRRSTTHAPNVECWPALARALPGVRAMALRDGLRRGLRRTSIDSAGRPWLSLAIAALKYCEQVAGVRFRQLPEFGRDFRRPLAATCWGPAAFQFIHPAA